MTATASPFEPGPSGFVFASAASGRASVTATAASRGRNRRSVTAGIVGTFC